MSKELTAAINRTDKYASIYVRLRDADYNGIVTCCCCGDRFYWEKDKIINGHFVPKGNGASGVRWLPHNMNGQCSVCNTNPNKRMKGLYTSNKGDVAQIAYTQFMQRKYGDEIVDDLKARKFIVVRYSLDEIREIGSLYKQFGEELRLEKGL